MATKTLDDTVRECPYCGHTHQPERENYNNNSWVEECDKCGKKYYAKDSFSVTHYAEPDCDLNDESHDWQDKTVRGRVHPFCTKCDKCMQW